MNEERHEEIMNAISNLSAQFSEMLREFKKREELLHEADDATLSTNDLIDVLGISKPTLNRLRQRRTIPFRYISANQVVYPYRDLVREIMMGRITFKGLSKNERSAAIAGLPGDDSFALRYRCSSSCSTR